MAQKVHNANEMKIMGLGIISYVYVCLTYSKD